MVGGAIIAVSLPMAAFAVTPAESAAADPMPADEAPYVEQYRNSESADGLLQLQAQIRTQEQDQVRTQEQDQVRTQDQEQTQSQDQEQIRKRLQVHIETGPPDGLEPTQERLRQHEQQGTGNADAPMRNQDAPKGNPDAPRLGDGTGDCTQDGELMGTGPHGPGGRNNG